MKRLIVISFLLWTSVCFAGDTTNNSHFYLPSIKASGEDERTIWFNTFQNTDGVIDGLQDAAYWTNGADSTLTAETDLEAADLTVTGDWQFNTLSIGTATPETSAILELDSTTKTLLIPRITDPSASVTTPLNGMIVYDSGDDQLQAYANGDWVDLGAAGGGGGGGSTVTVQYGDSTVMSGTIAIDISSSDFVDDESPTDEWNLAIKDKFVLNTGDTMTGQLFANVTGDVTGNADTATALAANGADCAAGEIPLGVDASGAVVGCYEPSEADISDLAHTATAITDELIIEADLNMDNAPVDGDILQYDSTGANFTWVTCAELTGSADLCDGSDDGVGGGGGGSTVTLEVGDTQEQTGTFTMDFDSTYFSSTEDPASEENITMQDVFVLNTGDSIINATQGVTNLRLDHTDSILGVETVILHIDTEEDDETNAVFLRMTDNNGAEEVVSFTSPEDTDGATILRITNDDGAIAADSVAYGADYTDNGDVDQVAFRYRDNSAADELVNIYGDGHIALIGRVQFASADNDSVAGAVCISDDGSDRLFHDTDCDQVKDGGEEFIDAASAGDEVTVNSSAVTSPANFLDNTIIEFDLSGSNITGTLATDSVGLNAIDDADTPSNGECLTYQSSTNSFLWATCGGGGGGGGATNKTLPVQSAKISGALVTHTPAGCSTTASTAGAQIDAGDGNWRLLFDATTDEAAVWQFVMPSNYSSTPTLDVHFSMTSGASSEVEFEAAIACITPTTDTVDVGSDNFANCAIGTATTVSATAGEGYSQVITLTDDSCAAGDDVWIWVSTDADDATNDDATGDREVYNLEFGYTGS